MDEKRKKTLLYLLIAFSVIILIGVGSTFAYFTATVGSAENAVAMSSAEFEIDLKDDIELIKNNVIPSIEEYVDIASKRVDDQGNFLKPYKINEGTEKEEIVTKDTVCIDDNLNEICSVYTFTIINPMTSIDIPLYVTLNPSVNTFENLYFKVLDSELNEVISATRLLDDRYEIDEETGTYKKDAETGAWIKKENFNDLKISPIVLEGINKTLVKATDENTPSTVTYSIVIWIMETHQNQNTSDGGKIFASSITASAGGPNGGGITGIISTTGVE